MPVVNKKSVLTAKRGKIKDTRRETLNMMRGHNDCVYACTLVGGMCNFLEMEGHSRGCKPDKKCKRYKKAKVKKGT